MGKDVRGSVVRPELAALPAVSKAGSYRLVLQGGVLQVSINSGAYVPLATGTASAVWQQTGVAPNQTVDLIDPANAEDVQIDATVAIFDDAAALPAPTGQQLWVRREPADASEAVISGRLVGEGRTGEYSAPVFVATRERVAASPDIWQSGYVFSPQPTLPGDVGLDVAFHAWPRVDAGAGIGGIAFQADATAGSGREWAQVVQAYEQPLRMRSVSFTAGKGFDVLIQADGGIGAGNGGGDIRLEPTGGAVNGTDPTGSVICQPKQLEQMSPTTGPIFEARAQPDVQPGISYCRADWHGLEAPSEWTRSGVRTTQIDRDFFDFDPGGNGNLQLSTFRIDNTLTANASITGIVGGRAGRRITVMNVSADPAATVTLPHEDGTSSAANRFSLAGGADIVIRQFGVVELVYDGVSQRWRALEH